MNHPSIDDPRPPGPSAEPGDESRRDGRLHLTTSLLIRHEDLRAALQQRAPDLRWDKQLVSTLRAHQESAALSRAIEPLFNDIADRTRGLFVEDFLIDTTSINPTEGYGPNVCDIIDIDVPDRVFWDTEGQRLRVELDHSVRFAAVRCRAFWVAHSNQSLSYHLSFELSYQHSAPYYYALSLLQKLFFPTEGTSSIDERGDASIFATSRNPQTEPRTLPVYIRDRFQLDTVDLFETVFSAAGITPENTVSGADLTRALLDRDPDRSDTSIAHWRYTCMSVLEDPYFFRLLQQDNRNRLAALDPVEPIPTEDGVLVYSKEAMDRCHPDHLAYYFLSGFFQNVIDFLRQDLSEVQDGTDPIYPPPAVQDDSGHFIVYATPASLYEVVSQSRSLSAGRGWIGTCPYLFLVHLMTLHNEDLVRRYEHKVRTLIDHLKEVGLLDSADQVGRWRRGLKVDETFTMFRRFRLSRFEEVHQHRYFNVLRYDTERAFYESIEEVRGIRQREQYWSDVVAELESTVDDLREARRRRADDRRNKLLAAVAVIGVLQVVFQVLNYFFEKGLAKIEWAVGLTIVTLLTAAVIVGPWWRSDK